MGGGSGPPDYKWCVGCLQNLRFWETTHTSRSCFKILISIMLACTGHVCPHACRSLLLYAGVGTHMTDNRAVPDLCPWNCYQASLDCLFHVQKWVLALARWACSPIYHINIIIDIIWGSLQVEQQRSDGGDMQELAPSMNPHHLQLILHQGWLSIIG